MIDIKRFSGVMDTDSPNEDLGLQSVKSARNIRYRGTNGNLRAENIPGTTLIANTLPAGTNENIGAFYDNLKQRIFYFNYNSNANHGIYILDLSLLTVSALLVSGTNTDGDILVFTLNESIFAVKMLYGDAEQGDTLYFNNCQKEPCQVNIERTLAGTYGVMKRAFLEVIKYPAARPPYVVYGNDTAVTVNTLRKKLFKFKTRATYFSREQSVTSMQSEVPLPVNYLDSNIDKDPTKNCKISIVYETLDADVEKIEILGAVTGKSDANSVIDPNQYSDFFLIATINKAQLSLPNNDLALFEFYNNQVYLPIDPEDSIQVQDYVPLGANALEMLNGNVPIYGGITENFDSVPLLATSSSSAISQRNTQLPYIFVGTQSGDSAFGTGNIHVIIAGTIAAANAGDTFNIVTTNQTVSFVVAGVTTASIITGLAAAAVIAGFTVVSSDTQNLTLIKTGESLQRVYTTQNLVQAPANSFCHNWNDREAYAIQYFDAAGRTNGSVTTDGIAVQTVNYTETTGVPNIPDIGLSITSRPPITAKYFSIGRSISLAKLKFLYWISHDTYKDTLYAYISIENLNAFILANPDSKYLAYDFSAGDRIRFLKVLSGTVNTIYTTQDFEIVGQQFAPIINGVPHSGQYIKIALPTTSGTFDFGTAAFFNYFIELYTPALPIGDNLNQNFEWGERGTVGDAGLSTRYHQGGTQNQTPNLSQPALFDFQKGEFYYRQRKIIAGNVAKWNILEQTAPSTGSLNRFFFGLTLAENTIDIALYNVQSTYSTKTLDPANWAILKLNSATSPIFNVTGTIIIRPAFNYTTANIAVSFYDGINPLVTVNLLVIGNVNAGSDYTFNLNTNFTFIAPYTKAYFSLPRNYQGTVSGDLTVTEADKTYTVGVVDANFSDYFQSGAKPNGRDFIVDVQAKRVYNSVLLRWGLPNVINSNINQVSRFKYLDFDEVDNAKGDIEILSVQGRTLDVLQRRACGTLEIYAKVIQDNNGSNTLVTTDEIITKQNIQYLEGDYGVGSQKYSFAKAKFGYYFTDPVRGYQVRRSRDGLVPINELYKGQYLIRDLITPYSKPYLRTNGAPSHILGYYDYFEEAYNTVLQEGTYNGSTLVANNFGFNETRNAYCCFYDIIPEWIISAQDKIFAWKAGAAYIQNDTTNYCKFFGVQFFPSVTLVFNDKISVKKTFEALSYQANQYWVADTNGDIITSQTNPQTGQAQVSQLITADFEIQENIRYAAFLRDANSGSNAQLALVDGDILKGVYIVCKLTYKGNNFAYIYAPYINYDNSPRNF